MVTLKIENQMKSRSQSAIAKTSYMLMANNMTLLIKRLWPWITGTSLTIAIAYSAAIMIPSVTTDAATITLWSVCAISSMAALFLLACTSGSIMALLKGQDAGPNIVRALKFHTIPASAFIAGVMLFYAVSISLVVIWHQGMLLLHLLIALAIAIITSLLLLPTCYSGMKYMAEDGIKYRSIISKNYFIGIRFYGRLFITIFVSLLIGIMLAMLLAAPLWEVTIASLQDSLGMYFGDLSGMPQTAPLLIFTGAFIAFAACSPVWLWQMFCIYYQYGSISARQTER